MCLGIVIGHQCACLAGSKEGGSIWLTYHQLLKYKREMETPSVTTNHYRHIVMRFTSSNKNIASGLRLFAHTGYAIMVYLVLPNVMLPFWFGGRYLVGMTNTGQMPCRT